jgi:hypothetical protein
VKTESLKKILDCFTNQEEFHNFAQDLAGVIDEIVFTGHVAHRNLDHDEFVTLMALKQFFVFGLFCQQNIEVIHELIKVIEYTEVTEDEKKDMTKDFPNNDLDRTDV